MREVISGELVISGGDATKLLELIEEALDGVAFAVKRKITSALDLAVGFGRDHGCDVACRERTVRGKDLEPAISRW